MSDARQLLGMKGASGTTNIWKLRLQLMKPVTWIPLIWGVVCGAAASGNFQWKPDHVLASFACMLMSGPLLAGYTQTINDYYDREIDAINEPYRPIPSGAISLGQVKVQIWVLLLAGLAVGWGLDLWAGHTTPVLLLLALGCVLPVMSRLEDWLRGADLCTPMRTHSHKDTAEPCPYGNVHTHVSAVACGTLGRCEMGAHRARSSRGRTMERPAASQHPGRR